MESDRGYVCARHERFVKPGEECPHCEKVITKAAAPRPSTDAGACRHPYAFLLSVYSPGTGNPQYICGVCNVVMAPTPEAVRVPLMNRDVCAGCGRTGLDIMQRGETYKTHACFRVAGIDPGNATLKGAP